MSYQEHKVFFPCKSTFNTWKPAEISQTKTWKPWDFTNQSKVLQSLEHISDQFIRFLEVLKIFDILQQEGSWSCQPDALENIEQYFSVLTFQAITRAQHRVRLARVATWIEINRAVIGHIFLHRAEQRFGCKVALKHAPDCHIGITHPFLLKWKIQRFQGHSSCIQTSAIWSYGQNIFLQNTAATFGHLEWKNCPSNKDCALTAHSLTA